MTPPNATSRVTTLLQSRVSLRKKTARTVLRRGAVWLTTAVSVSVKNLTEVKLMLIVS